MSLPLLELFLTHGDRTHDELLDWARGVARVGPLSNLIAYLESVNWIEPTPTGWKVTEPHVEA